MAICASSALPLALSFCLLGHLAGFNSYDVHRASDIAPLVVVIPAMAICVKRMRDYGMHWKWLAIGPAMEP
jgi:uncharacterized membrane protein YhaH (DUF805 family)